MIRSVEQVRYIDRELKPFNQRRPARSEYSEQAVSLLPRKPNLYAVRKGERGLDILFYHVCGVPGMYIYTAVPGLVNNIIIIISFGIRSDSV